MNNSGPQPTKMSQPTVASCRKDATTIPCQIITPLDGANFALAVSGGITDMAMLTVGLQTGMNPNRKPGKEERSVAKRIKHDLETYLPKLDANSERPPAQGAKQLLQTYRAKFVECEEGLRWLPGESSNDYKARKASCALQLQDINNEVASALGFSVDKTVPEFRSPHWGDRPSTVMLREGAPVMQKANELAYKITIDGQNAVAAFFFADGKLARGEYMFENEHSENGLYIDDFESVKAALTKKYGKADDQDEIWKNTLFKNDRTQWGTAIAAGQMFMYARWHLRATEITLVLRGDNFKIADGVVYDSIQYAPALRNSTTRQQANGL